MRKKNILKNTILSLALISSCNNFARVNTVKGLVAELYYCLENFRYTLNKPNEEARVLQYSLHHYIGENERISNAAQHKALKKPLKDIEENYDRLYRLSQDHIELLNDHVDEYTGWRPADLLLFDSRIAFWLMGKEFKSAQGTSVEEKAQETDKLIMDFKEQYSKSDLLDYAEDKESFYYHLFLPRVNEANFNEIKEKASAVGLDKYIEKLKSQRKYNLDHRSTSDNVGLYALMNKHNELLKVQTVLDRIYIAPEKEDPVAVENAKIFWNFIDSLDEFITDFERTYSKHLIENGIEVSKKSSAYSLNYILTTTQKDCKIDVSNIKFDFLKDYRIKLHEYIERIEFLLDQPGNQDRYSVRKLSNELERLMWVDNVIRISLRK